MGVVYEAVDEELRRRVALKTMLAPPGAAAAEDEERFLREARLAARLPKHPGVVGVHEAGSAAGRRYIAMEFVDGRPFSKWRREPGRRLEEQVAVLRDTALAVHHAHAHGVLHRDLKPENVLVDAGGSPHVTDFGLAKSMGQDVSTSLTASGMVMGTPTHMSPEQARGLKSVDGRSDVYSLGVMLYEVLAGRVPFQGETAIEVLMKAVKNAPVPPSTISKSADRTLEAVALKCLAKRPQDRYASAEALARDLGRWLDGEKVRVTLAPSTVRRPAPRRGWVPAAAAAVAVLAVAGFAILFSGSREEAGRARQAAELARLDLERKAKASEERLRRELAEKRQEIEAKARAEAEEAVRRAAAVKSDEEKRRLEAEVKRLQDEARAREEERKKPEAAPTPPPTPAPAPSPPGPSPIPAPAPAPAAPPASEPEPAPPAEEAWTAALDLLEAVEPSLDALSGTWKREGEGIASEGVTRARLEFPYRPPAEYDLRLKLTPRSGTLDLALLLSRSGRPFGWRLLDPNQAEALAGLDRVAGAPMKANPTAKPVPGGVKYGQKLTLVAQVREGEIRVYLDGRLQTRWKTDGADLSGPEGITLRSGESIGLGVAQARVLLQEAELIEVKGKGRFIRQKAAAKSKKPGPKGPVDLLRLVDPAKDSIGEPWKLEAGKLSSPGGVGGLIQIPYAPPEEYDLLVAAARVGGHPDALGIGLVVGERQVTVMIDARDGDASGLERVDGKLVHQNDAMARGDIFPEKAEQQILCSVRKGRIGVTVKGKPLIDWTGDFGRLSGHTGVQEKRGLYLSNSLPVYQIRQLILIPVSGPGTPLR
jgi:hypothetical protein